MYMEIEEKIKVNTNKVRVNWVEKSDMKCLKLTIEGRFVENNAMEAVSKWKEELSNYDSDKKASIICNCSRMTGYDANARKIFQQY